MLILRCFLCTLLGRHSWQTPEASECGTPDGYRGAAAECGKLQRVLHQNVALLRWDSFSNALTPCCADTSHLRLHFPWNAARTDGLSLGKVLIRQVKDFI